MIDSNAPMGGTTWVELFILFDTDGHRGADDEFIQGADATRRAEARRKAKAKRNYESRPFQRSQNIKQNKLVFSTVIW